MTHHAAPTMKSRTSANGYVSSAIQRGMTRVRNQSVAWESMNTAAMRRA